MPRNRTLAVVYDGTKRAVSFSIRTNSVCPICGVSPRDQHSLSEAGKCDGIRNGKIQRDS